MKRIYRIAVPARIHFDVAAESEEQAKALAVAMVLSPVEPLHADMPGRLCYAVWHDESGTPEFQDEFLPDNERELAEIEQSMAELAEHNGNTEEYNEALSARV